MQQYKTEKYYHEIGVYIHTNVVKQWQNLRLETKCKATQKDQNKELNTESILCQPMNL